MLKKECAPVGSRNVMLIASHTELENGLRDIKKNKKGRRREDYKMSAATLHSVRPSSLPLPKTISHSNPAERLALRGTIGAQNARNLSQQQYRASLLIKARPKLASTSSSAGSTTPTTPGGGGFERQVKSLTPERDLKRGKPVRKVSSVRSVVGRGLKVNENERKTSVANNNKLAVAKTKGIKKGG